MASELIDSVHMRELLEASRLLVLQLMIRLLLNISVLVGGRGCRMGWSVYGIDVCHVERLVKGGMEREMQMRSLGGTCGALRNI